MLNRKQALGMSNLDLINVIDLSEGEIWRLGHNVSHGRTTEEAIASPVSELNEQRDLAYKVLSEKTGIKNNEEMIQYAHVELAAQNKRWDDEWMLIHKEGAVFIMIPNSRYGKSTPTLEVIGAYVARAGNCSYKELVVVRYHGRNAIRYFDNRDIPLIERLSVQPIFQDVSPEERGLIKVNECMERRPRGKVVQIHGGPIKKWRDFNFAGTFRHSGFGKFHTMNSYNAIEDGRDSDNEIILARPLSKQKYWVEFKEADLADMELVRK